MRARVYVNSLFCLKSTTSTIPTTPIYHYANSDTYWMSGRMVDFFKGNHLSLAKVIIVKNDFKKLALYIVYKKIICKFVPNFGAHSDVTKRQRDFTEERYARIILS